MFGPSAMQFRTGRKSFEEDTSTSIVATPIIAFSEISGVAPSRRLLSVHGFK